MHGVFVTPARAERSAPEKPQQFYETAANDDRNGR
jgi:hypothetical protein